MIGDQHDKEIPLKRFARMAATTLSAVAILGSAATVQAEAAPTAAIEFAGATGTPSPNDIVMHWRGTCTNPGQAVRVHITFGHGDPVCRGDGTYEFGYMVYDYRQAGLEFGKSFDYRGFVANPEFRAVDGSAVLGGYRPSF